MIFECSDAGPSTQPLMSFQPHVPQTWSVEPWKGLLGSHLGRAR